MKTLTTLLKSLFVCGILCVFATACSDDEKETPVTPDTPDTQEDAYITLSETSLELDREAQTVFLTFVSNYSVSYSNTNDWITVGINGNDISLAVTENVSGGSREGRVTFKAGDGGTNVAEAQLEVIQDGGSPLILVYDITVSNTDLTIPLYGTVDCVVDWGDGSEPETIKEMLPTHTYANTGRYEVSVLGTVTQLYSARIGSQTMLQMLTGVKQWGDTGLTSMANAFGECAGLKDLPEVTGDAFANVDNFEYAFYFCVSLESIPEDLFHNCPKATSFEWCFGSCQGLKTLPDGLFGECPVATIFNDFCWDCNDLEYIPEGLFKNCPAITTLYQAFGWCDTITTVPADLFAYTPEVDSLQGIFDMCDSLSSLPAGLFDNCAKNTSFRMAFEQCPLTDLPEGLFDKCVNVTDFRSAFNKCTKLTCESPYTMVNGQKVHLYERDPSNGFAAPANYSSCFSGCTGLSDYDEIPSGWK